MNNRNMMTPVIEYEPGITYTFEFPEQQVYQSGVIHNIDGSVSLCPTYDESELKMIVHITAEKIIQLFGVKFMNVIHDKYFTISKNISKIPFFFIRESRVIHENDNSYVEMTFVSRTRKIFLGQDIEYIMNKLCAEAEKELDKLTFFAIEHDLNQGIDGKDLD